MSSMVQTADTKVTIASFLPFGNALVNGQTVSAKNVIACTLAHKVFRQSIVTVFVQVMQGRISCKVLGVDVGIPSEEEFNHSLA